MVDVILCPVGPGPAPRLGTSKYWSYTSVWNLLDWPALVFPATTVDATKDAAQPAPDPLLSEKDRENWDLWREGGEAEGWNGLPVGLQLVGRRGEDEKVWVFLIGHPFSVVASWVFFFGALMRLLPHVLHVSPLPTLPFPAPFILSHGVISSAVSKSTGSFCPLYPIPRGEIVTLTFYPVSANQDEQVLEIMSRIEKAVGGLPLA